MEADETFTGGKIKNMRKRSRRHQNAVSDGNWGQSIVLFLLSRERGAVRAKVTPIATRKWYPKRLSI
jgi:hypothetical protein